MKKAFKKSLFLFRRDLRLEDNTGLIFASKESESVIPAFIFTPEQIDHNSYRSDHCLLFMTECLHDLEDQLKTKGGKLYLFKGSPEEVVKNCITKLHIDALVVNRDYTPYSVGRDAKLEKVCHAHKIAFHSFDDALLHPPEDTLKSDGKPYTIFTPYFHNASKEKVRPPTPNHEDNYFHGSIPFAENHSIIPKLDVKNTIKGGRSEGLKLLKQIEKLKHYEQIRDFPAEDLGLHLSPYLKFTVISPREVYAAICKHLGSHHGLIRSLYWRDFFSGIALFFPYVFKGCFRPKFDKLKWSYNKAHFKKWCEGKTGFPLVDAGMREMNETGFMHNRVRMVTASFLTKDLHIDWRLGEQYFAQTLVDYDPAVNNGNWQWVAGTGSDAQPYFRIFNPWNQQKKFDPDCIYIKKWVPELSPLQPKIIHSWYDDKHHPSCRSYLPPMVVHEDAAKESLRSYKSC